MTTLSDIGLLLKSYRKRLGLTQSELAARCKIHRNTLSALENGMGNIELNSLLAICEQLGLDIVLAPSTLAPTVRHAMAGNQVEHFAPDHAAPGRHNLFRISAAENRHLAEPTSLQKRIAERLAATAAKPKTKGSK